jgi:hypothetical protein
MSQDYRKLRELRDAMRRHAQTELAADGWARALGTAAKARSKHGKI